MDHQSCSSGSDSDSSDDELYCSQINRSSRLVVNIDGDEIPKQLMMKCVVQLEAKNSDWDTTNVFSLTQFDCPGSIKSTGERTYSRIDPERPGVNTSLKKIKSAFAHDSFTQKNRVLENEVESALRRCHVVLKDCMKYCDNIKSTKASASVDTQEQSMQTLNMPRECHGDENMTLAESARQKMELFDTKELPCSVVSDSYSYSIENVELTDEQKELQRRAKLEVDQTRSRTIEAISKKENVNDILNVVKGKAECKRTTTVTRTQEPQSKKRRQSETHAQTKHTGQSQREDLKKRKAAIPSSILNCPAVSALHLPKIPKIKDTQKPPVDDFQKLQKPLNEYHECISLGKDSSYYHRERSSDTASFEKMDNLSNQEIMHTGRPCLLPTPDIPPLTFDTPSLSELSGGKTNQKDTSPVPLLSLRFPQDFSPNVSQPQQDVDQKEVKKKTLQSVPVAVVQPRRAVADQVILSSDVPSASPDGRAEFTLSSNSMSRSPAVLIDTSKCFSSKDEFVSREFSDSKHTHASFEDESSNVTFPKPDSSKDSSTSLKVASLNYKAASLKHSLSSLKERKSIHMSSKSKHSHDINRNSFFKHKSGISNRNLHGKKWRRSFSGSHQSVKNEERSVNRHKNSNHKNCSAEKGSTSYPKEDSSTIATGLGLLGDLYQLSIDLPSKLPKHSTDERLVAAKIQPCKESRPITIDSKADYKVFPSPENCSMSKEQHNSSSKQTYSTRELLFLKPDEASQVYDDIVKSKQARPVSLLELSEEISNQLSIIDENPSSDSVLKALVRILILQCTEKETFTLLAHKDTVLTDLNSIYNKALMNLSRHEDVFRVLAAVRLMDWRPSLTMYPHVNQCLTLMASNKSS